MNTTNYAVIVSPCGGIPSVQSKNSNEWYDFMQAGYEVLNDGTKRQCHDYLDEMVSQLNEIQYFN